MCSRVLKQGLLGFAVWRACLQASLTRDVLCLTGASTDSAVGLVKHKAETLLRSRHAGERMLRCWGSGAGLVFDDTREAIKKLLSVRARFLSRAHCICNVFWQPNPSVGEGPNNSSKSAMRT